ncbi:MAG: TetR/AcrR family transcriptional regulator [Vulcanimicrobiota bacterium]
MTPREWRSSGRRRREILEAAARLYLREGEEQLTIGRLAQESEASVGSIYHHFKNKEHLLGGLVREILKGYRDQLVQQLEQVHGAEAMVKTVVRHHLLWVDANRNLARLLHQARKTPPVTAGDSDLRRSTGQFLKGLKERFLPYIQAGQVMRAPLPVFQAILIGPAHELARNVLSGRCPDVDLVGAADILAEAAWKAVKL